MHVKIMLQQAMTSINAKTKKMKTLVYSNISLLNGCLLTSRKGGVL